MVFNELVREWLAAADMTENIVSQGQIGGDDAAAGSPEAARRDQLRAQEDIALRAWKLMGTVNGILHPRGGGGAVGGPAAPPEPVPEAELKNRRFKRAIKALRHIRAGGIRRSVRMLMTKTPPPHVDAAFVEQYVKPLFPPLMGGTLDDLLPAAWEACAETDNNIIYSIEAVQQYINSRRDDAAAGISGLAPRALKDIWHRSDMDQQSDICLLLQRIGNGYVPPLWLRMRTELARLRAIPIPKAPKPGYRPIGVGEILLVVADGVLAVACAETLKNVCGGNLAIGTRRGAEIMAHIARAAITANKKLVVTSLDAKNAFGTVSRRRIIARLVRLIQQGNDGLRPILRRVLQMYTCPTTMEMRGADGTIYTIEVVEGNVQGLPLAVFLYVIAHTEALEEFQAALDAPVKARSALATLADDIVLVHYPHDLPALFASLKPALLRSGIELQDAKTRSFRVETTDAGHETLCSHLDAMGVPYRNNTEAERGVTICGALIGTSEFQRAKLEDILARLTELLAEFEDLVTVAGNDPPPEGGPDRTKQAVMALIRLCGPSRLAYWGAVTEPAVFGPFAERGDDAVFTFLQRMLALRAEDSTLVAGPSAVAAQDRNRLLRLQMALSTRRGGLGINANGGRFKHAAYLASFVEATPIVVDRLGRLILDPPPEGGGLPVLKPSVTRAAMEAVQALRNGRDDLIAPLTTCAEILNSGNHTPTAKLQEALNDDIDESNRISTTALGCSSAWARFWLLSIACTFASAWLNLIPLHYKGTSMTNREFVEAIRLRLGLHPLAAPADGSPRVDVLCAWCLARPIPVSAVMNCAHILLCPGPSFNGEHNNVRDAIISTIDEVAKKAGGSNLLVEREAQLERLSCVEELSHHERIVRAGPRSLPQPIVRMDLYTRHLSVDDNATHVHGLYDVTFCSPPGSWVNMAASDPTARTKTVDHFIDEAIKEKNFHFVTSFRAAHHAHTSFYPLAFDRSGRPGATTLRAIDGIKKMLLHFSQSSASKYSVEQALTDRISVAFQSGLGRHVSVARQLHTRELARATHAAAAAAAAAAQAQAGQQLVPPVVQVAAGGGDAPAVGPAADAPIA